MRIIVRRLSGRDAGLREVFPLQRLVIGRDADCHVRFDLQRDLEVSGHHAEIVPRGKDVVEIIDLNSTNGVMVNGKEIKSCRLKSGDEIELGPGGPQLRFELRRAFIRTLFGMIMRTHRRNAHR